MHWRMLMLKQNQKRKDLKMQNQKQMPKLNH
jgi:hypothetical protein